MGYSCSFCASFPKDPLTGAANGGHTHPVYSITTVGTQNANNIISCSTDGVVCGWTADMLSKPQDYLILTAPPPSKTEDLSPLCMDFPAADPTSFLVGTEEGTIYPCHRYERAGAGAGTDARLRYKGHTAPVTSLDFHPARGPIDFGDLFLSTGLDWSIKLWKSRPASSTSVAAPSITGSSTSHGEIVEPLLDLPGKTWSTMPNGRHRNLVCSRPSTAQVMSRFGIWLSMRRFLSRGLRRRLISKRKACSRPRA